jgi:hypothetical protein
MKRYPLKTVGLALLLLTSCSSAPKVEKTVVSAYKDGVPGGTLVETYIITAKITDIDAGSRKVTLLAPDGSQRAFTAGPRYRHFDRLRIGDEVQAKVTRQLLVFLGRQGAPPAASQPIPVAVAPDGSQAGVLRAETVERTAKVGAVDRKRRQATLEFADGTSRSFDIRKDVELGRLIPGEEVVIRTSSAVVLTQESP